MANLSASQLPTILGAVTRAMNDPNRRRRIDAILPVLLANQSFMLLDPRGLKESPKRAVQATFRKRKVASNSTARSHNFAGNQIDTAVVTLNWYTFAEDFSINLSTGADNVYPTPSNIIDSLEETQRVLRERIGLDFVTKLHANRNTVGITTPRLMSYNVGTNAFENPANEADNFIYNIQSLMKQANYRGPLDALLDPKAAQIYNKLKAQGANTAINQQYQFMEFANAMEHTALGADVPIDPSYVNGAAICMPQGTVSVLPWIPKKYRDGFGQSEWTQEGIGTTIPDLSGLPITYSLRGYSQKTDSSASNGDVDDITTFWQLSVDMSFNIAPTETAGDTPIYEFAQTT